ncbi:hypothetical protein AYL99_03724 [Fonsecaea erecta]|uniref:Uncharacterized protein n=1 Tax=Fonsecaea erecta TaxID=1367422 RepID=A0A178ZPY4_9EURO|nr:hypothetical protein AYL99_03724 [Fonsecaea erecta]OAP61521.1 hypothetical protein AYL99_03724 [Fonsecaea erecta]
MFAGPHDQLSEKDIREGEAQATAQVQFFTVACVALWFYRPDVGISAGVKKKKRSPEQEI